MIRNSLLVMMMLAFFIAATAGCGKGTPERTDMPVKASPAVDTKTGKRAKSFEASIEDPPRK